MQLRRLTFVLLVLVVAGGLLLAQETPLLRTTAPHWPGQPVPEGVARFKFAVISDIYGGRKPDSTVLADSIKEINLLDPDFTICVGDLVEGYTNDPEKVKAQRDAFDSEISRLKRPFYCVFGNHDSTNPVMEESLRKRYGSPWYSFNHKNCHFVVLFTESRSAADETLDEIDPEQLAWLKRDLAANPNADQYFIFMHRPFQYEPSWEPIESLFDGKKLTVFSGHLHEYHQMTRKGHDYIVLSSTGGAIPQSGFWSGGFYHHVLVTVTGKDSSVAIIRSGAIIPPDLLNDNLLVQLARLRQRAANLTYQVPRDALEVNGDFVVSFDNPLATPIIGTLSWEILPNSPWKVDPLQSQFTIEPGKTIELKCRLTYPANPFGPNPAAAPGYSLVMRSGRREDSHTPYDRGRDEVVNVRALLKIDPWPYSTTVHALSDGMDLEPLELGHNPAKTTRTVKLANPLDTPMTVVLTWKNDNPAWSITPSTSQLLLPPGQNATADFEISCSATDIRALPVPSLALVATADAQPVLSRTRLLPVSLRTVLANYCPVAKVPPFSADPKIDGVLDEPVWSEAVPLGQFMDIKGFGQAPLVTNVRIGRGRTGLYLAVVCHDPDVAHLAGKERDHDGAIWRDDFIELFIDSKFDRLTYTHLAVNAFGTTYDAANRDDTWEGHWLSAVTRTQDSWTVELFIPWSDLGGPPAPETRWGFDVARRRPDRTPEPVYTFWSPTLKEDSHVPDRFGILLFP